MSDFLDTVPGRLLARATQSPAQPAYWRHTESEGWEGISWSDVLGRVNNLSKNLVRLGLRHGDRVVILLPAIPEWEICQIAALSIGCIVVGIDDHDTPDNIRDVFRAISPRALFLNSGDQLNRLGRFLVDPLPLIITIEPCAESVDRSLRELIATDSETSLASPPVEPEHLATIIFTSGSTGQPKGIGYTHSQLCLAGEAILECFPMIRERARLACWLPLSNLFQRIVNLCAMMRGAQSYFVESPRDLMKLLPEIQPALLVGVPRFFEKLCDGIDESIGGRAYPVRELVRHAWNLGERFRRTQRSGSRPALWLSLLHLSAESLVLRRLRRSMGLDVQFMISGSAPLAPWIMERLHGLGWLILEAYGISENVLPIALNTPRRFRFGSVGHPLAQNEVKLAEDGEVLVRGEGVFTGYYGKAQAGMPLDSEGFLHTADIGRLDDDGFLWLIGRKSEIFKTSTGRRIAPSPVETLLKQLIYVEHAVLIGRDRPVPVALLFCVNSGVLQDWKPGTPLALPLLDLIGRNISEICASVPFYQRPAGALITLYRLSITGGELTSNLKLRRKPIEDRYDTEIDGLYRKLANSAEHSRCLVVESE